MQVTTHLSLDEVVRRVVESHIEAAAQKIADEYKEKALKDLEEAIRKAVTETAVHFSKMIDVSNGGDKLTITISDRRPE